MAAPKQRHKAEEKLKLPNDFEATLKALLEIKPKKKAKKKRA